MSPNVVMTTSGSPAMAIALSRSPVEVTQTGQPGPDSISIFFGRSWRMPCLRMLTVCPPQNSIRRVGRLEDRLICLINLFASSGSRYSSTNFNDLSQQLESFLGFGFVQNA